MSALYAPHLHSEVKAYQFVEAIVWPEGPTCPHCGGFEKVGKLEGKSTRIGVYKCYDCLKPFTVKVGTIFESSHVKMHLWLQAIFLMVSSKKGISSNQLHRTLGVTLKTAWFMSHRIREAMKTLHIDPMGNDGQPVEVDETYFGDKEHVIKRSRKGKSTHAGKRSVVALVERGGRARTIHVERADKVTLNKIIRENINREASLYTDESNLYNDAGSMFEAHESVNHSKGEYVRGEAHTNTAEGYFSIFKRGMKGVYQHCSEKHLHRYLAEFDFRYSNRVALGVNDLARTNEAVRGIIGKRLTYRTTDPWTKTLQPQK
jgi:transposase-like protein